MRGRSLLAFGAAWAAVACGLLASPGDYASGVLDSAETGDGASTLPEGSPNDPDSGVSSRGTIAFFTGERDPLAGGTGVGFAGDVWLGSLDASGRITGYAVGPTSAVIGQVEAASVVDGRLITLGFGYGIGPDPRGVIQTIGWGPGPTGTWTATIADGPGLADSTRTLVCAYVVHAGGTRQVPFDGGMVPAPQGDVNVAAVDGGALGSFTTAAERLNVARSRPGIYPVGSRFYVVGGRTDFGSITSSVEVSSIDKATGEVSALVEQPRLETASGAHRIFLPSVAEHQGWLFVGGGRTNGAGAPSAVVLVSKIDAATGGLSVWKEATPLPSARRDFGFVGAGGKLYVAGGILADGTRTDEVLSATIQPDGTLSAWDATNAKLPEPRSDLAAVVY